MENKLNKLDLFAKSILIAIIICIAYIFGYPSGKRLMVIGILIVIFGYWWKWNNGWMIDGSNAIIDDRKRIEKKYINKEHLTLNELMYLLLVKSFYWMRSLCLYIGIFIALIGCIFIIIY